MVYPDITSEATLDKSRVKALFSCWDNCRGPAYVCICVVEGRHHFSSSSRASASKKGKARQGRKEHLAFAHMHNECKCAARDTGNFKTNSISPISIQRGSHSFRLSPSPSHSLSASPARSTAVSLPLTEHAFLWLAALDWNFGPDLH